MKKALIAASLTLGFGLSGGAMATTFDFDAETNERGANPLVFSSGGMTIIAVGLAGSYVFEDAEWTYAYLDAGVKSGLGVCNSVYRASRVGDTAGGDDFAGGVNECSNNSDDNMADAKSEWLAFFKGEQDDSEEFRVDGFQLFGNHVDYGSDTAYITVDGFTWESVAVDDNGHVDLGGRVVSGLGIRVDAGLEGYVGHLDVSQVPVPGTLGLLGLGLLGLGAMRRKAA